MKRTHKVYQGIDDYFADLSAAKQREVELAEQAIDLAFLLYQARTERHLSQTEAGSQACMTQQQVSRMEQIGSNIELATLQKYLAALGYKIVISVQDIASGTVLGAPISLPS